MPLCFCASAVVRKCKRGCNSTQRFLRVGGYAMYTWTHKVVKLKRSIPPLNKTVCACLPALSVCLKSCNNLFRFSDLVFSSPIWFLVLQFGFWFSDLIFWFSDLVFWFSNLVFGSPIWFLVLQLGFWRFDKLSELCVRFYCMILKHYFIALLLAFNKQLLCATLAKLAAKIKYNIVPKF